MLTDIIIMHSVLFPIPQAVCRAWLVRKELKDTQAEFLQVVSELDGPAVDVEWSGTSLPRPVVAKASKKPRSINTKRQDGHTPASEQTAEEIVTSSKCAKCACMSREPTRNNVSDMAHVCPERVLDSALSPGQGLGKAQAHQEAQTDLKLRLPDEKLARRVSHEDGEASHAKHSLASGEAVLCDDTVEQHLQANFPEGRERVEKGLGEGRDRGWHVQGGAGGGESHERGSSTAVNATPIPCASTADPPTPTITLTPTSSTPGTSGSTPGERSSGSVASPAADSWTPTRLPVSEGGPGSRTGVVDSFHGDQTSMWDSSSSINQGKSQTE